MDFIERFFGLSPDGGDGSTEMMYFLAFATIAVVLAWRLARKKTQRPD
jgi:hypothetical protein